MNFSGVKAIAIPEGNVTKISSNGVTLWEKQMSKYTNLLPLAIGSDGKPYNNGQGWKANTRLGSSGSESTSNATGIEVTGFMPVKFGDKIYLKNVEYTSRTNGDKQYFTIYDSSFKQIAYRRADYGTNVHWTYDENNNATSVEVGAGCGFTTTPESAAYFRLSAYEINNNSIITVNEPID